MFLDYILFINIKISFFPEEGLYSGGLISQVDYCRLSKTRTVRKPKEDSDY